MVLNISDSRNQQGNHIKQSQSQRRRAMLFSSQTPILASDIGLQIKRAEYGPHISPELDKAHHIAIDKVSSPRRCAWLHDHDDNQGYHHQHQRHERYQNNGPAARRELAQDDVLLRLEVPVVAEEKDQYADAQEHGSQGLAQVAQGVLARAVGRAVRDRRVEPEELRDGDANGGEGE